MKRIDFEAHYYTQDFLDAVTDRPDIPTFKSQNQAMYHGGDGVVKIQVIIPKLLELGKQRIKDMDAAKIDKAVLSATLGVEQLSENEGCKEAQSLNDALGEAVNSYPERFLGYVVLNVKNITRAAKELERCRKKYKFVGWNAYSNYGEQALDDPIMLPLFKKAVELGMFVYIHPTVPLAQSYHGWGPALATSGLGFAADVSNALTRLILSGIFDILPELKVVIGHSGEALPFLLQRLDDAFTRTLWDGTARNKKLPSEYFQSNIWVTTSGNFSYPAFRCAYDALGIDRIMFGTDYPMESMEESVSFVDSLPISLNDVRKLYHGNAEKFFGIV